jgi:NADP-dependent 3-hydroxy acid dehydrogenase YdfG
MLLEGQKAMTYGAGGAIGGAVSRAFAREGVRVFLTGRTLARVEAVTWRPDPVRKRAASDGREVSRRAHAKGQVIGHDQNGRRQIIVLKP